jgi:DNA-binding beta-propeller fold protein YncE
MGAIIGEGDFRYEHIIDWHKMPEGARLIETPGVAVDSQDDVYAFSRNPDYPVMVFDQEGNFVRGFGKGIFGNRTHGIYVGPEDTIYCVDDGIHTITKFTREGELLMTIGTPGVSSEIWKGEPFNRPTHAAVSRETGHIYISDGYGNFNIHKYTGDGEYVKSWGGPGIDPGEFLRPHNIAVDNDNRVLVADREAHRIQVFDGDGNVLDVWNNIHMPNGMTIGPGDNIYVGELPGATQADPTPPRHGHRVTIYDNSGKRLALLGADDEGEESGAFIAPHGMGVDSSGNIYVGEVSFTIRGSHMDPPKELRSFTKLAKVS